LKSEASSILPLFKGDKRGIRGENPEVPLFKGDLGGSISQGVV
jgi:hypothetical protein